MNFSCPLAVILVVSVLELEQNLPEQPLHFSSIISMRSGVLLGQVFY